jgi:5-methylcytosine-specific restriction endonuclease McrA
MPNKLDLTGQQFDRLTAVEPAKNIGKRTAWRCKCICGEWKDVKTDLLMDGTVTSCGCKLLRKIDPQDIVGQRFGNFTVSSVLTAELGQEIIYSCLCDCGVKFQSPRNRIITGGRKSCGCLKSKSKNVGPRQEYIKDFSEIKDKRFGALVVKALKFPDIKRIARVLVDCDCGKINADAWVKDLLDGSTITCGCGIINARTLAVEDIIGKTYNRLTVLEKIVFGYKTAHYRCKCICGNIIDTPTKYDLENGRIQSCGCFKMDNLTKYSPKEATANSIFISNKYNDEDLTLQEFMTLVQLPCYYCNIDPSTTLNLPKRQQRANVNAVAEGDFTYNGLDRIDPNLGHLKSNVVPACWTCNRAKLDMPQDKFKQWIINCYNYFVLNNNSILMPSFYLSSGQLNDDLTRVGSELWDKRRKHHPRISSAKAVYNGYKDGDISFEKYLELSQYHCFYCNTEPSNAYNVAQPTTNYSQFAKDSGTFIYNGLDRISPEDKSHNLENCVPCCFTCNSAKNNMTLDQFKSLITSIYNHWASKSTTIEEPIKEEKEQNHLLSLAI